MFRNCNGFALEEVDGGTIENIIVSNITMQSVNHYPVYITLGSRNRGPQEATHTGTVKNIFISNIIVTDADSMSGIQITGTPGFYINNVQLQNIFISYKGGGTKEMGEKNFSELENKYPEPSLLGVNPAYGLFVRHVKDLRLNNITFTTLKEDSRPAIICSDVNGLYISNFKAPETKIQAYRFNKVTNLSVQNAPLLKDAADKTNK